MSGTPRMPVDVGGAWFTSGGLPDQPGESALSGPPSDGDVLGRVALGDASAFETFFDRHGAASFSLAVRLLGDRQAAEDVVQESFLAAWRFAGDYRAERGSGRTWLLSILRHKALDAIRRRAREAQRQLALEGAHAAGPDVAAEAISAASGAEIRRALGDLPPEQSQVLRLAYYAGMSHQEIAVAIRVPLGTVKSRARIGLGRLRRGLGHVPGELLRAEGGSSTVEQVPVPIG